MAISWSVSRIKSYQSCKLNYDLNYNQGIKNNLESPDAIKGTAFHAIAEEYQNHQDWSFDQWIQFLSNYEHYGKKLNLAVISLQDLKNGFINLQTFWKEFIEQSQFDKIIPEQKVEFEMEGSNFQGIIDLTLVKDDKYAVLDYKTTKSGGSGSEHALQLSTYVKAVHSKYEPATSLKDFVSRVTVYVYYPYTKFKTSTLENLKNVKLKFSDIDESINVLLDGVDAVESEANWSEASTGWHCNYCGFAGTTWCTASQIKGMHRTRGIKFFKKGEEIQEPEVQPKVSFPNIF